MMVFLTKISKVNNHLSIIFLKTTAQKKASLSVLLLLPHLHHSLLSNSTKGHVKGTEVSAQVFKRKLDQMLVRPVRWRLVTKLGIK